MSNEAIFECPNTKCQSKSLIMVRTGITEVTTFYPVINASDELNIRNEEITEVGGNRFECGNCGYVLRKKNHETISCEGEIIAWIKDPSTGEPFMA